MTRVESFDNLAPMIDSLNLMLKDVINRETLYNKEDAELILEIMKARTLVECAGSLAVIADSLGVGEEDLVKKFGEVLFGDALHG